MPGSNADARSASRRRCGTSREAIDGENQRTGAIEGVAHHHDGLAKQHRLGAGLAVDRHHGVGAAEHRIIVGLRRQQDEIVEAPRQLEQAAGRDRADLGRVFLDDQHMAIGDRAQQEIDGRDLIEIFRRPQRQRHVGRYVQRIIDERRVRHRAIEPSQPA